MSTPHQQEFETTYLQNRSRVLDGMTAVLRDRDAAKELTAAAFVKGFKNLHTFRGESNLYTRLYRIALREAWNYRRRQDVLSLDAMEDPEPMVLADTDRTAEALEARERTNSIEKGIAPLPATNRRTLEDHFLHGYSVKQIARKHGVPIGTVLSRIFSGKRLLRAAWEA